MITTILCLWYSSLLIRITDLLITKLNYNGKWFQLHAITNYVISFLTYNDVIDCIKKPENSYIVANYKTSMAIYLAAVLHLYHSIMFKMRKEDWHHHLSGFVMLPFLYNWQTKGTSMILFFITGFPGAIDYTMLTLFKNDYLQKYTVKYIYSFISAYIRLPGGCLTACLLFKDSIANNNIIYSPLILSIFIYLNACFYGKQAMENFGGYKITRLV